MSRQAAGLRLESLGYRVGSHDLVNGVNLQLSAAGITALMGFNGAGKSLLLRLMHGLLKPTAGRVLYNGVPVTEAVRRRQAMVFQRPVLLRRSVAANMDFVLHSRGIRDVALRQQLLQRVGLGSHAARAARKLSGGEQQRLALARALAVGPEVLFLDEATASLDPASIRAIETVVLDAAAAGCKVVVVTHDIGQARRLAQEVVFLHNGRVTEQSVASQFFRQPASAAARAYLDGRINLQESD